MGCVTTWVTMHGLHGLHGSNFYVGYVGQNIFYVGQHFMRVIFLCGLRGSKFFVWVKFYVGQNFARE